MTQAIETIGQWLEKVASSDSSTESDSRRMQNLLRRVGFPKAVVELAVVYVEGEGTMEHPPLSIQQMARLLARKAEEGFTCEGRQSMETQKLPKEV